ncbi:MAG: HPF/RaiA family ribosome-associated protein [Roseovarius sp.]|nr:HPF/RaiA family ribosome-associated protein [Roseovarius sp.]
MQIPLECSFHDVEHIEEIETLLREKVDQLEAFHAGITSCRVHLRAPHKRHRKGNLYEITVEVRVPGTELAVHHHQEQTSEHEHLAVAIRDAFTAMSRKLKRRKQKARGDVKAHEGQLQGKVSEIHHAEGFGQITANDHRLIYFHRNSVIDGRFDDLKTGDAVEMVVQDAESDMGPQASTVRPIGSMQYTPGG